MCSVWFFYLSIYSQSNPDQANIYWTVGPVKWEKNTGPPLFLQDLLATEYNSKITWFHCWDQGVYDIK